MLLGPVWYREHRSVTLIRQHSSDIAYAIFPAQFKLPRFALGVFGKCPSQTGPYDGPYDDDVSCL